MTSAFRTVFVAALASLTVSGGIVLLERKHSEATLEATIERVITENPEVITRSLHAAQVKQKVAMASEVSKKYSLIDRDLRDHPDFPAAGNPRGDITVIEFFDYHCGYCKHFAPVLLKLIEEDHNIRVVFKEFPILSDDSAVLAKAALAVNRLSPSQYYAFHRALMESKETLTPPMLARTAKELGVDPAQFAAALDSKDLDEDIARNRELGKQLTLNFTPAIIVAGKLFQGNPELITLKQEIAEARRMPALRH